MMEEFEVANSNCDEGSINECKNEDSCIELQIIIAYLIANSPEISRWVFRARYTFIYLMIALYFYDYCNGYLLPYPASQISSIIPYFRQLEINTTGIKNFHILSIIFSCKGVFHTPPFVMLPGCG